MSSIFAAFAHVCVVAFADADVADIRVGDGGALGVIAAAIPDVASTRDVAGGAGPARVASAGGIAEVRVVADTVT